jgi:apolipoprotein N-acyltransferase
MKLKPKQHLIYAIVLSLTLGLAPFFPEPHIYQKLKWILDGGIGMQGMDYFDVLLHGFPWLYLMFAILNYFKNNSV